MTLGSDIAQGIATRFHSLPLDPALAIILPGQGSQKVGMGKDIAACSPAARRVFAIADRTLGENQSDLCFNGPEEELTRTTNAQPAILTTSIAILAAALESGTVDKTPAFLAGHSLGEYTALVAAGSISFEDTLLLVRERSRLMDRANAETPGTMAAIVGLSEESVADICNLSGAEPCNYNSPTQIVVGGTAFAVKTACRLAKERGGRGLPLNVSGAFHTSLMDSAARDFAHVLESFTVHDPSIPVVGNVTATCLTDAARTIADLAQQISAPVRWSQSISFMMNRGVSTIVEIGPGHALAATLKRSYPDVTPISIDGSAALTSPSNV
jgi:[acyl-carrier-protein] S-malonyltransferase